MKNIANTVRISKEYPHSGAMKRICPRNR